MRLRVARKIARSKTKRKKGQYLAADKKLRRKNRLLIRRLAPEQAQQLVAVLEDAASNW